MLVWKDALFDYQLQKEGASWPCRRELII